MTVAVAGLWERGWFAPLTEAPLWSFMLREFGPVAWLMSPVSGIAGFELAEHATLAESIQTGRELGLRVVFVDEAGEDALEDFIHPVNALYIFGRANGEPLKTDATEDDLSIRITTEANLGLLWAHQAAAVVLHHRRTQWP